MPAIGEVIVTSWRHTFDGLLPDAFLASLSVAHQTARHSRIFRMEGAAYFVAERLGRVIGFASGGPCRAPLPGAESELYAIYLLPEFARMGIGSLLFRKIRGEMAMSGRRGLSLMALAINPSCAFYRRLGGTERQAASITLGGHDYAQTAFVWADCEAERAGG